MMKKKELDIYKELGINSKQKISCKGKSNIEKNDSNIMEKRGKDFFNWKAGTVNSLIYKY